MIKPLAEGDKAPCFSLPDKDGELIHSEDYQNERILLYFYPKAMTPGCTIQACNLRDNIDEFKKHNITIIGISTDKPEKLLRFTEKELLNFDLLSDHNHTVAESFGVWGQKEFMGKTYDGIHRISFLIGIDGVIEKIFDNFKTSNHHDIILNYLKKQDE